MKKNIVRIAYLIDSLRIGGTEKQLAEIVKRLDPDRFEPVIICIRESNTEFIRDIQCEIKEIQFRSFKSFKAVMALFKLIHFLRSRRIDIVQTFFVDATLFGVIGAKLAGVRKIISSRRDLAFWHSRGTLNAFGFVNRWVDRFWVNSSAVGRHLERLEKVPDSRIDVMYNGIDLDAFQRQDGNGGDEGGGPAATVNHVVGIVANLNREVKRVDLFIRAAALVGRRFTSVRFWIVGEGHLRESFEALGLELGLEDRLRFFGSRSDVAAIARDFSVGVICSDSEGFSNSILEYFALGVPVVATDVGGNPEIIRHGVDGYLVGKGDHEMLANRINELVGDDQLRTDMGRRGWEKVSQQFAWPSRIEEIQRYYRSLMSIR